MAVTIEVYLGTRPLTVSGHTAWGHLTSSGIGWAACCMIMAAMVIVTWWSLFRSGVQSQIAQCHRRQACTSHVLLARHKRMSTAVSWHPLLTGSLDLRQWALLKMTRSFSFLAISSSSSRGGGRPGNMTMVESSQGEQNVEEHLCLGCIWDRKCPRV